MAASVIVYSAEWCPWCHKVIDFLKENKVKFEVRDVEQGDNAKECMHKSGQGGIPVTIIDGEAVVGFDTAKIKALLKLK